MIVIGADPHKQSHTFAAVEAATGEQLGCETVKASTGGRVPSWPVASGSCACPQS